jgi:hypothetical protein
MKKDSVATPLYMLNYVRTNFFKLNKATTLHGAWNGLFDPCPLQNNFDKNKHVDGLEIQWKKLTFVNPPFSRCMSFFLKAIEQVVKNGVHVCFLCKSDVLNRRYAQKLTDLHEIEVVVHHDCFPPVFVGYESHAVFRIVYFSMKPKKVVKEVDYSIKSILNMDHEVLAKAFQNLCLDIRGLRMQGGFRSFFVDSGQK